MLNELYPYTFPNNAKNPPAHHLICSDNTQEDSFYSDLFLPYHIYILNSVVIPAFIVNLSLFGKTSIFSTKFLTSLSL